MNNTNEKYLFEDEKYFYLYKHVDSSDGSLCILSEGTLKFTNPKNFNDPFDCKFSIDANYIASSMALKINEDNNFSRLSPAKRVIKSQRLRNLYKHQPKLLKELSNVRDQSYICCLNQNPLNILMWSHYAQQHKGFLIEFRFKKNTEFMSLDNKHIFIPFPIHYSQNYPHLVKEDRLTDAIVSKGFLTKSEDWIYENEWRIIRYGLEEPNEIQKYPRDVVLTSVVAGISVESDVLAKWEQTLSVVSNELNRSIPLYKAEILENTYALTVPGHPRLDTIINTD